jgi:hypothetical protein
LHHSSVGQNRQTGKAALLLVGFELTQGVRGQSQEIRSIRAIYRDSGFREVLGHQCGDPAVMWFA